MSTIERVKLSNVRGVSILDLAPKEMLVKLVGPNGCSKTTIIESILVTADPNVIDGDPISYGEKNASTTLDVRMESGAILSVTRSWKIGADGARSTQIKVEKIDGEDVSGYKDVKPILAKLFGPFSDVRQILQVRTPKQERDLADALLKGAGVSVKDLDDEIAAKGADRTDLNRRLTSARARHEAMKIPRPGLPDKESSVAGAAAEISAWRDQVQAYAARQRSVAELAQRSDDTAAKVARLRRDLEAAEIEQKTAATAHSDAAEALDAMERPPSHEAITVAEEALGRMEQTNSEVRAAVTWRDLAAEVETLAADLAIAQNAIDAAREAKLKMLREAKMPVDGLAITEDGGITFEGIGLHELSDGQRLVVGIGIALATMGSLRAVFVDRGESIDAKNEARAAEMCENAGVLLIIAETAKEASELVIRGADFSISRNG